jgi:hypothetical protein
MRLEKLVLAVSAIGLLADPAWAGFAQGNKVTMGGNPVFSIAGSAGGYSPDHRAWLTQDALDNALVVASDKSPGAVSVSRMNGAIVVLLDGQKVATADSNSANLEGTTPQALAEQWANGIRNFLANSSNTANYVAELTGKNPINAQVAVIERRLYAPPGTVLPIAFTTEISSETIKAGDQVQGTLTQDVAFGRYAIPAGAKVVGLVSESEPGSYAIALNTLVMPNGLQLPIIATVTGEMLASGLGPHLVATEGIPYGVRPTYLGVVETACRVPATIGIGTVGGGRGEQLVLRRGTNVVIAAGAPMAAVFDNPMPVAVVLRPAM